MGRFWLGVVVTLVVLAVGGFVCLRLGLMPTNADAAPFAIERSLAAPALDASVARHAPHVANPVPETDENLIAGMKVYTMNCAVCHGGFDEKPSALAHAFYPPPPQLVLHPPRDPEWRTFYVVRTGVRYTGMPAWETTLSAEDMWKVTALLSRIRQLPPAVRTSWKDTFGTAPPGGAPSSPAR